MVESSVAVYYDDQEYEEEVEEQPEEEVPIGLIVGVVVGALVVGVIIGVVVYKYRKNKQQTNVKIDGDSDLGDLDVKGENVNLGTTQIHNLNNIKVIYG